jgi:hypothetical protein
LDASSRMIKDVIMRKIDLFKAAVACGTSGGSVVFKGKTRAFHRA